MKEEADIVFLLSTQYYPCMKITFKHRSVADIKIQATQLRYVVHTFINSCSKQVNDITTNNVV